MLTVYISGGELFNEETNEFITVKPQKLELEHSLISLSKWESVYHKPFIGQSHTYEESCDYVKCMTISKPSPNPLIYRFIDSRVMDQVNKYLENPMTATTIHSRSHGHSREPITSEIIYYDMVALGIPFIPCEKWHLNRLLTLIKVCDEKNNPQKMSNRAILQQNAALNAQRRAKMHSKG